MKISLNWLRDFLVLHNTPTEIADILTSLGLEVEGFEEVKTSPADLDKVVTGLVTACEPIPDTDHLSATQVEVSDPAHPGQTRTLSIVCGAPNVATGQKVFVALPGANVFSKDGTLFTIAERKVRGVPSQGMICAEDELGLGHDHSGIMVLPPAIPLGITAAEHFNISSDIVFEVGLTPNRADATNHLGVARDLLAYMRHHNNPHYGFKTPDVSGFSASGQSSPITVTVENQEACPRYAGVCISGVQVKESPDWLKNRLLAVGIRPINNIVDVTNYVRAELGQPLHAFDRAAIAGNTVLVKTLPEGTPFQTLDEVERKLFADDLMICDGNSTPMCIGGVFGGAKSGVKDSTTDIFLESACFNPRSIRRSMLKHNLRTDAAWAFEKGVDPNGTVYALQRAALLILDLAGGTIDGPVTDLYPEHVRPAQIPAQYSRINTLIGEQLPKETVQNILQALNIGLEDATDTGFTAIIPTNKPDVTREADLVEEILRVYGLDTVPMPNSIRSSMEITPKPDPTAIRNQVSDVLAAQGFLEAMCLSLSDSSLYQGENAVLPFAEGTVVRVHNTANQGLDCLRPTLVSGILETVRHNQNRQNPDLRLFEFGKIYSRTPVAETPAPENRSTAGFTEVMRLGLCLTGAHSSESWHPTAKKSVDFFTLKTYVNQLLARMGISGYQETALQNEGPFKTALRYHRGPQEIVTFGAVQTGLSKKFDVKNTVYFADFHFENMVKALSNIKIQYSELSRFPTVRRDLALVLDQAVTFGEIRQLANKTVKKALKDVNLFDVFEDESKIGQGKKSYAVSFVFEDFEKTLQDKEIDQWMQQLQTAFQSKLGAVIRS
jgi:phenylalanyl-tRNA synthetase beta chain